jgi:hypothetical protein
MSSSTGSAETVTSIVPKGDTWGILFSVFGIITIVVSLYLQFSVLDHGSSNQLTIDAEVQKSIWGVLTGVLFFVIGIVLWLWFSTLKNKYMPVFLLSLLSYIGANTAIMLSLYQVQVNKV